MVNRFLIIFLLGCISIHGQQRIVLFANGYLGPKQNKETTQNKISTTAPGYWYAYDDTILKRFQPASALYISGHHPLLTSSHSKKFKVSMSWILTRFCIFPSKRGFGLNTKPNYEGFDLRMKNGKICGENYLALKKNSAINTIGKDTLDIVCHSMGYAYILGFLSAVDTSVVLGKVLIISPESAQIKGYDWNKFQEVWQYGSNLGEKHADFICLQDGIAPQAKVKNLENLDKGKGGRVFVPKTAKRGFIKSHHLLWFDWFYEIQPNDYGYFSR